MSTFIGRLVTKAKFGHLGAGFIYFSVPIQPYQNLSSQKILAGPNFSHLAIIYSRKTD